MRFSLPHVIPNFNQTITFSAFRPKAGQRYRYTELKRIFLFDIRILRAIMFYVDICSFVLLPSYFVRRYIQITVIL